MTSFNELKNLYEDGYRCIYHDQSNSNHTVYLKNFDSEHSQVVEIEDENEFSQFQDYMNGLKMS
ncbi:MAG: hypothetical protein ACRDA3_15805 [Peptostreptococcaceae bacterium]